jgi:CRISPR-associated endonuclease C2c1-like protein
MPTRSINLKLIVPRHSQKLEAARSLWVTHAAVNEATAYYERRLLLCRGASYVTDEAVVPAEVVRAEVLALAREAQSRNGGAGGTDDEICSLLRRLYEAMVPSVLGVETGNAQAASGFLGPLTDPDSDGYLKAAEKAERPAPSWLPVYEAGDPTATEKATAWLKSDEAEVWLTDTGSPARWVRLARAGDPKWIEAFVEKRRGLCQEASTGVPSTVSALKRLGVLPLFAPFLQPKIANVSSTLGPWDRLAIRLAVSHLLSWESWCRRAAAEYAARKARLDALTAEIERLGIDLAGYRKYEADRKEELGRIAFDMGERAFLITRRMIRS